MPTQKNLKDANLHYEKYLPAAAATNQSPTIDLGQVAGGAVPNDFEILITVPALANNTDSAKTTTLVLQDSADDSSYADTDPVITINIPGVTSTGSAARTVRVRVPSTVARYLQFTQTVPSGGGDNTLGLIQYDLVF